MHPTLTTLGAAAILAGAASAQDTIHVLDDSQLDELYGSAVLAIGDVDGDGFTDFAVGDPGSPFGDGGVVAYSGATASELYRLSSSTAVPGFGVAIAVVGDLDGDGHGDLAVSAPAGVLAPNPNATIDFFSAATGAPLPLSITGSTTIGFGASLEAVPDLDGDGEADLAVGCPGDSTGGSEAGAVRVFSTDTGAQLWEVLGANAGSNLGASLALVDDLDGDGFAELLAGAPTGEYVRAIPTIAPGSGYDVLPPAPARDFGWSVARLGDLNGDGVDEYAIGAPGELAGPFQAGTARIYSGADDALLHTLLGDFDGDRFGSSVCNAGDVDLDGVDDVAVGGTLENSTSFFPAGIVRVVSGADASFVYSAIGTAPGARFGHSVTALGDVNGDTRADLLVGSPGENQALVVSRGGRVGTPMCFGDGSGVGCPCGNDGGPEEGCASSVGSGARLFGLGSDQVSEDYLVLQATGARPNMPGLFLQGAAQVEVPFKDGLLCLGAPTERLQVVFTNVDGAAVSTASIVTEGNVSAGQTRYYQYWFRDAGGVSPCGTGSNFSSGLQVDWN